MSADKVLNGIITQIIQPVIYLLFAVAFLVFFWGMFKMIKNSDSSEERDAGRRVMLYGTFGLLIMFGAYGIIALIKSTFSF